MVCSDVNVYTTFIKLANQDDMSLARDIKHQFASILDDECCDDAIVYDSLDDTIGDVIGNWMKDRLNKSNDDEPVTSGEISELFGQVCEKTLEHVGSIVRYEFTFENICNNEGVCIALVCVI